MDKQAFFARLTDASAAPDPAFIEELRKKIITISAGAPPASSGGPFVSNPGVIAIGITTAAIAGIAAFGLLRGSEPEDQNTQPIAAQVIEAEESTNDDSVAVLGDSDEPKEQQNDDQDDESATTEPDNQPAEIPADEEPTNQQEEPAQDPVTDPEDNEIATTYTVSFWNIAKGDEIIISEKAPDLQLTNVDAIDFDWGIGSPDSTVISSDYFVAQAESTQYFEAGNYKIDMTIDDGVRVYVNGALLYDRWTDNSAGIVDQAFFTVKTSGNVEIVFEYFEQTQDAIFKAVISENTKPLSPPGEATLIQQESTLQLFD